MQISDYKPRMGTLTFLLCQFTHSSFHNWITHRSNTELIRKLALCDAFSYYLREQELPGTSTLTDYPDVRDTICARDSPWHLALPLLWCFSLKQHALALRHSIIRIITCTFCNFLSEIYVEGKVVPWVISPHHIL